MSIGFEEQKKHVYTQRRQAELHIAHFFSYHVFSLLPLQEKPFSPLTSCVCQTLKMLPAFSL